MKAEKMSRALTGVMLSLFTLLIVSAMLLGTLFNPEHRSYTAALAAAALLLVLYRLLLKKRLERSRSLERLGAFKAGALLALICLSLNLAWILVFRIEPTVDFKTFWISAVDLAELGRPSMPRYLALFPHILGYSSFLSWFVRLFGPSPMLAPVINVILTTISGLAIYILCLRWRDLQTAALAFLLWAVCPSKLLYNAMVLSEPFYTCLILLFMLLVSELERRSSKAKYNYWLGSLAAVFGALILRAVNAARPIAAVPIIAFLIWLFLLRGEKLTSPVPWRRYLSFAGVLLAVYLLTGPLWNAHLEKLLGEEPAGVPGYSICVGFNAESGGSYSNEDMDMLAQYDGSAVEAHEYMLEEAKARIRSGELDYPRFFAVKIRSFLGCDEGGAFYSMAALTNTQYSLWAIASNIFYYALILLAIPGVWNMWLERRTSCLLMAPMYVLGLTLAQMLVEVAGRYHYSIIPMLIIAAAFSCGGRKKHIEKDGENYAY